MDRALLVQRDLPGRVVRGQPAVAEGTEGRRHEGRCVPLAQLLGEFEAQFAQSNEIVAGHSLDEVGKDQEFTPTLRWILLHMVEETARHIGHLDVMRELLDGKKGYYSSVR